MKTYSIIYDLGNPGRDYDGVAIAILSMAAGYCRPTESHWLINSSHSGAQIRDSIGAHLDAGDKVLVTEVGVGWASWGLSKQINDWLRAHWRSACLR